MTNITCIHTVQTLIGSIDEMLKGHIDDVTVNHMYDDYIVKSITRNNGFKREDYKRLLTLLESAEETGCDFIFVTCSSLSSAVEKLKDLISTPIIRIDEPMIKKALKLSKEITVVATAESTLKPTVKMIRENAKEMNMEAQVDVHLVENALDYLKQGKTTIHDQLILDYIRKLEGKQLILLAQGSMAHLQPILNKSVEIPVLSSPKAAVEYIKALIKEESDDE